MNLTFDGHCEAAFRFYEQWLGGKITVLLTWGDSPMAKDAPADWAGKILYARLKMDGGDLLGADVPPPSYEAPRGFGLMLTVEDPKEAERLFHGLSQYGTVRMPLQETFWAQRYGGLVDQFGIPWEINCEKTA